MPGIGTGQRRPRGKAHRLPRQWKQMMIGLLQEEADYGDIVAALQEAGCPEALLPSERSVALYHQQDEYAEIAADWKRTCARSEQRAALATALAEGGIEAAANLVTFESLDRMYTAMQDPEAKIDPTKFARLAVAVKQAAADEERARLKAEIAALKARVESKAAIEGATVSGAELMAEFDAVLLGKGAKP